jgi:hypothetical protein
MARFHCEDRCGDLSLRLQRISIRTCAFAAMAVAIEFVYR